MSKLADRSKHLVGTLHSLSYRNAVAATYRELQNIYDTFCHVSDPAKLTIVRGLIAQEGAVDLEVEGLKSADNQRDLTIKFHWGHNHRFNDVLAVTGRMGDRHLNLMAQFLVKNKLPVTYFREKSVIDVGCWTGGTTLLLKALGAGNILALEEVQKYAKATKCLLADVYDVQDVVCEGTNLYDLETDLKYDVAYFPGVIYHLSDPVVALRRLFNALQDGGVIFVETAGIDEKESVCRYDGNRIHHVANENVTNLNRGGWNWFLPSASCLQRWMIEAGFEDVSCFYSYLSNRIFGFGTRTRHVEITRAGLSVRSIE